MPLFQARPTQIEAEQYNGRNVPRLGNSIPSIREVPHPEDGYRLRINHFDGTYEEARPGDYIVRDLETGKFRMMDRDFFIKTYQPVDEPGITYPVDEMTVLDLQPVGPRKWQLPRGM